MGHFRDLNVCQVTRNRPRCDEKKGEVSKGHEVVVLQYGQSEPMCSLCADLTIDSLPSSWMVLW
jgi:hypothetical protein